MLDGAHSGTTLTGAEEVSIDRGTARSPYRLSADLASLLVQPGSDVWGVARGVEGRDIVDVPWAGKGTKDLVVAVALSVTASGVGSGVGTIDDLKSS